MNRIPSGLSESKYSTLRSQRHIDSKVSYQSPIGTPNSRLRLSAKSIPRISALPKFSPSKPKKLVPVRKSSNSRTLAEQVIRTTFGEENMNVIYQKYPQLHDLNDNVDDVEEVKGS